MTPRLTALAALAVAALTALPAAAQGIKPGLWEVNHIVATGNPELDMALAAVQQQIAGMAPEQRQRIDEMMGKRGLSVSAGAGGGIVAKMCVTKEMAAQNQVPMQQAGDCTEQRSPIVGNRMKVGFNCTHPQASGEGVVTFSGDSAYSVKMNISSSARGKPETVSVDASGKWLGADCGALQPAQ
jgi:hypothetical protein